MKMIMVALVLALCLANNVFAQEQHQQQQQAKPELLFPPLPSKPKLPTLPPLPSKPKLPTLPPLPSKPKLPTLPPLPSKPKLPTLPPLPSKPKLPPLPPMPSFSFPPLPSDSPAGACLKDLESFLETHKISISSECCSVLEKVENPLVQNLVKQQCASADSPSST